MALSRNAARMGWLLIGPLALQPALLAAALDAPAKGLNRSAATLLAQAPGPAEAAIPMEVQGWADGAAAAYTRGEPAAALRLQRQVLAWTQANRPALDVFRARAFINLGTFLSAVGQQQEAMAPTEEAVRILRQLEGSQPEARRFLAIALNNLGKFLGERSRHQEALAPTEEAVKVFRLLAETNPAFLGGQAIALRNLGIWYRELGRRQEALASTEEAVKVFRQLTQTIPAYLGELAATLNNLGIWYSELGRRQEALAPTKEAAKIYRDLAKTNPTYLNDLAMAQNNLGKFLGELGRRQEALAPTEEMVKTFRLLAQTNPAFLGKLAIALNNLGIRYTDLGRHQEALAPTEEALHIRRELVKTNPALQSNLAISLNNLSVSYSNLGRSREALALSEEAVKVYRDLAKTNPAFLNNLATSMDNLGSKYIELGRRQEALAPKEAALKIRRELAKSNLANQENLAISTNNLAVLQLQLANPNAALPLLRETVSTDVTYLQGQLPLLPESRRLELVAVFGDRWQIPFSQAQQGEAGASLALFTRLNRQGLLQDIQRSQVLLARSGPQRTLFEQLTMVTAQLASTTLTPQQQAPLLALKEQLEQELYRQLPQIQPRLVEPAQIAALLSPGSVLVEFQRYRSHDGSTDQFGPPRYLALLLRPDGTIRAIGLGEAAPIDAAVAEAVAASADPNRQAQAPQKLAAVSRLVLAPLHRELAGVRELFVSPDGELNRLPFAALPYGAVPVAALPQTVVDGETLGDAVALRLLTTGRDLLRLRQPARAGGPAVLIANPDFNAALPSPGSARAGAADGLVSTPWLPLAGTEQEARQLAPLLGGSTVISGPAATVAVVLAQKAPRILHIATHGFFLADPPPASGGAKAGAAAASSPARQDPLQRSGLVFAGANRPAANRADDGYLTAAEATAMDLEGTELVTLSACETGLGGVRSGEGVYGLQRSLAVAGARSTLLSLWKVDDGHTRSFLERYYSLLKAGKGRADALLQTQREFRNNKNSSYNDIRVWGAFQLSGDWRALPGW
jgi:CHAT domain-containing protein